MLWLGVLYLGSLAALFITSLWSVDSLTSEIDRTWTFDNFRTLLDNEVYRTVTLRTLGVALAVTVIDVLPNGNLLVAGEKQIGINQGSEFIRLSGIVNPQHIGYGNVVSSTEVAEARLEYRGSGYINEAQTMGWLARVFQSVMPF